MALTLTPNAISLISSGTWQQSDDIKPIVQVWGVGLVPTKTTTVNKERFRVNLSDGVFHETGMLGTQLNDLVHLEQLKKGSVVRLEEFAVNRVNGRLVIIILNVVVLQSHCDIIGDPKPYGREPSTVSSAAPMRSINQPTRTMGGLQNYTGYDPRPTVGVNSPIYPPQQEHNTGLHSYGMPVPHAPAMPSRPPANSNIRPVQSMNNQPPPMYTNRAPTAKNEAPSMIIPIARLNPFQGNWTIKARVTAKSELRHYNTKKGEGKVFSFDLLDSDGGEIRSTCFNAVADQFFEQIQVGQVYLVSKGSIKEAQKKFNHLNNVYEVTLGQMSTIQPCLDDESIPQLQFNFRAIAEIENLEINTILDIIGVVYSIRPSTLISRKNNTETLKRNLSMKDMSGRSVEVTLWGDFCNKEGEMLQRKCDSGTCPVLALKAARVGEYNGKTLGTISTSQLCIEPDFPEARELRMWYDNVGKHTTAESLSKQTLSRADERKTISQIKTEKLGTEENKADWITVCAYMSFIKIKVEDTLYYTACTRPVAGERICLKKVTKNSEDKWQCDRCGVVDDCDYRYILQLQIQDHTGHTWATAFQEPGEDMMGVSAKELNIIRDEEKDVERFNEIIRNALYTRYNFKLKVKQEIYMDDPRQKSTIVKVEKIKYSTETKFLLELLQKEDSKAGILVGASAPMNSVMGSVTTASGVGQSQMGLYGYQNSGSASVVTQQTRLPASVVNQSSGSATSASGVTVGQQTRLPASVENQYTASATSASGVTVGQQAGLPETGQYRNQYGGSATSASGVPVGPQAGLPETGQYVNQYAGSRQGVSCSSCGGVDHSMMNCPSAVNCSGGRYNNNMPSGGGNNNVSTAYSGGGNAAPGIYGNASGQYVGGR